MVDELNQKAIGIMEIEGAGAVPVGFRFLGERNPMTSKPFSPLVNIFRALDDNLFTASLAVAVRKGRIAGLAYVSAFLEQAKASGLIAQAIGRAGLTTGVRPGPPRRR